MKLLARAMENHPWSAQDYSCEDGWLTRTFVRFFKGKYILSSRVSIHIIVDGFKDGRPMRGRKVRC
jgi:hypothetical protein